MEPLSFEPLPQRTEPIEVETTPLSPTRTDEGIANLASRTSFGLGKSYEESYREILSGRENRMRDILALEQDMQKQQRVQDIIGRTARRKGAPLTEDELGFLYQEIDKANRPTDPNSVIEEAYAKKYGSELDSVSFMNDGFLFNARKEVPEVTEAAMNIGQMMTAKIAVVDDGIERADGAVKNQGWGGFLVDQGKMLSQIYQEVIYRGQVKDVGAFAGVTLGANLEAQARKLLMLPFDEFKVEFNRIINGMMEYNPTAARAFAMAVKGQSSGDIFLNDVFSIAALTGVGTAAKLTKSGASALKTSSQVRQMIKDATKEAADGPLTRAKVAEIAGNLPEAGIREASDNIVKEMKGYQDPAKVSKDALNSVFVKEADALSTNTGPFRREFVNRLVESYHSFQHSLSEALETVSKVERIPGLLKVEEAMRRIAERMKDDFPGLRNTILDVSTPKIVDPIANVYHVDVHFGQKDAKFFGSASRAEKFARAHKLLGTVVEQKGAGFYVKVTVPLNETDNVIRDLRLVTGEAKTPDSMLNSFSGWLGTLRTPEETLSKQQALQRKIATFAPSVLQEVARETAKDIKKLRSWQIPGTGRRQKWRDWQRAVDESSGNRDPATGEPGAPFRTLDEFSNHYQKIIGRPPDEQEAAAYFAFKRLTEMEQVLRKRNIYSNLTRIGTQSHSVQLLDKTLEAQKFIPTYTFKFNGVKEKGYPERADSMLIVDKYLGNERVVDSGRFGRSTHEKIIKEQMQDPSSGWQIYRVTDPGTYPLSNTRLKTGDSRIRYIAYRGNIESKPVSWEDIKVPKRPETDYDHYIVQPIMRYDSVTKKWTHEGDRTLAGFNIRAEGREMAKKINEMRRLIDANKLDEAKAMNPLPLDWDEVYKWFKPELTKEGLTIPARLSTFDDILLVPRHKLSTQVTPSIHAKYGDRFRNGTTESFGRTLGEPDPHDLITLENKGTKSNPLYNVTPVKYVSPFASLDRGLKRAIEGTFMDDYKIFSVESWVKEAQQMNILKATPEEIAENPFHIFHHGEFLPGADAVKVANMKTARFQINQLIGVQNPTQTFLHSVAQTMADATYAKGAKPLTPTWLLPKLRDPFAYMRAITFDVSIGLFALPQLMVQLNTFTTIFGVAGMKFAAPGTKASLLHQLARINATPEMLKKYDDLATKMLLPGTARWKPGEWTEARTELMKTGFHNLVGEHIYLDNPMSRGLITHGGQTFLDWGRTPFTGGERQVRLGAWYTAYREFREKNPHGRITDADRAWILNRADLLSVNMSRASASMLQQGVFSLPMQFLSYQTRLTELFLGKRLTPKEKGRLYITYAAMYGVPGSVGLVGLPLGDWIQSEGKKQNYIVGEKWLDSAFMEGIPAMLGALTTGAAKGDINKGNWYNISERYGVQGFELMRDILYGDGPVWKAMGGASTTKAVQTWIGSDPLRESIMRAITDGPDNPYPMKVSDWVDGFKEISSVANFAKLKYALEFGKWVTKKEAPISDVSAANAIFMTLSGLQPSGATDIHLLSEIRKDEKKVQDYAQQQAILNFRRAMRADSADQHHDYMRRAFHSLHRLGYPQEEIHKVLSIAFEGQGNLVDRITRDFYNKRVPTDRKEAARDLYQRWLRTKEGR